MRKNVYILSDAHLGSLAIAHGRTQERRLVRFLDEIKNKAAAIYLLGDMFDFWYEYKYAVPKGYTRFLGKLSELTDMGVEVHFFTGNHDIWMYGYLEEECGVIIHTKPTTVDIYDKVFYMATALATTTLSSTSYAACSTTASASACSARCIRAGASGSD